MILLAIAAAVLVSLAMTAAWLIARLTVNAGWVDVVWTFATGVVGALVAVVPLGGAEPSWRQALVAALALLWSLRLGLHVAARVAKGPEDVRYASFRREWGADYQRRMFWFLQAQAACAWVLAVAIMLAARNPVPQLRVTDAIAVAVLLGAIVGEALADRQLRAFRADPGNKGRICDTGLWRYSRHPNYFFEWLGWFAYPLFGMDFSGRYGWGWLAFAAPALMYWLLIYVSGIPPLEAQMEKSRPDAFRAYKARTSAFFPAPRRA